MSDKIISQRRAKPGGETGANGEFYEGGKFIATTDHAKSSKTTRRGTGRQEIEPYKWEVPPEAGMIPLFGRGGVFVCKLADGKLGLNPDISEHTWLYYHDQEPLLVEKTKARFQQLADRYNAGERWCWPESHPRAAMTDKEDAGHNISDPDTRDEPGSEPDSFSP